MGAANTLTVHVSDASFAAEIEQANGLVLVDFWAPWCMPCQMLGPVIEDVAKDLGDKIKMCKLNVDENPSSSSFAPLLLLPTRLRPPRYPRKWPFHPAFSI